MTVVETVTVLSLSVLPIVGSSLDRAEIARLAGCTDRAIIALAQSDSKWIAIVRCYKPPVPTADILRAEPWDDARQARVRRTY